MSGIESHWTWLMTAKPVLATFALILLWILESVAPTFFGRTRRWSHAASNMG